MTKSDADYKKVVEFLKSLGVEVVEYQGNEMDWIFERNAGLTHAPFTSNLAVNWDKREIVYHGEKRAWPELVHEGGHILGTQLTPKKSNEIDFLGWEFAVVQHLKLSMKCWHTNNVDYCIYSEIDSIQYDDIRATPYGSIEFDKLVAYFVNDAKRQGIVSAEGIPLIHPSRRLKTKEAT